MSKLPDGNFVIDIDFFTKVPSPPGDAGMPKRKTAYDCGSILGQCHGKNTLCDPRAFLGRDLALFFFVVLWKY